MVAEHACIWIVCFLLSISKAGASTGDLSKTFQAYFRQCQNELCTSSYKAKEFEKLQPYHLQYLGWDCIEECKYNCMWQTVEDFQQQNLRVPQFYGKWPFLRIMGMQEPASVLFSLLNGLGHLYMIMKFRRKVPRNAPMYYAWHIYSLKMDYFAAVSLNLSGILMISWRSLGLLNNGDRDLRVILTSVAVLSVIFWRHVNYLNGLKRFDYGYNMKFNLFVGLINSVWWIGWCMANIRRKPYLKNPIICIIAANLLLLLELLDFPPVMWTLDAHSLWHAGTIPLIFIWYKYVIPDSFDLIRIQDEARAKKGV